MQARVLIPDPASSSAFRGGYGRADRGPGPRRAQVTVSWALSPAPRDVPLAPPGSCPTEPARPGGGEAGAGPRRAGERRRARGRPWTSSRGKGRPAGSGIALRQGKPRRHKAGRGGTSRDPLPRALPRGRRGVGGGVEPLRGHGTALTGGLRAAAAGPVPSRARAGGFSPGAAPRRGRGRGGAWRPRPAAPPAGLGGPRRSRCVPRGLRGSPPAPPVRPPPRPGVSPRPRGRTDRPLPGGARRLPALWWPWVVPRDQCPVEPGGQSPSTPRQPRGGHPSSPPCLPLGTGQREAGPGQLLPGLQTFLRSSGFLPGAPFPSLHHCPSTRT